MDPEPSRGCNASRIHLHKLSFALGILSTALLVLSLSFDYWLHTIESVPLPNFEIDGGTENTVQVATRSGLWRVCVIDEDSGTSCVSIDYFSQPWVRLDGVDTTNSILRAIRKAAVPLVVSLLMLMLAVVLGVVRVCQERIQMFVCTGFYVFSALCLAVGMIIYVSSVNDEVSYHIGSSNSSFRRFSYRYGWAFYFAGLSFFASMAAAISISMGSIASVKNKDSDAAGRDVGRV